MTNRLPFPLVEVESSPLFVEKSLHLLCGETHVFGRGLDVDAAGASKCSSNTRLATRAGWFVKGAPLDALSVVFNRTRLTHPRRRRAALSCGRGLNGSFTAASRKVTAASTEDDQYQSHCAHINLSGSVHGYGVTNPSS
jgi:hypothetical protein